MQAARWVLSQATRLKVAPEKIEHAIRCGLFADDIERLGSNLAYVAAVAGRSPKITKRGRYDSTSDPITSWDSLARLREARTREQSKRAQKRQQRKAA